MNIGPAIKSIRVKMKVAQFELAEKTGIAASSLSLIETGVKMPSQKTLGKICDVLEIPLSIIYILAMQEIDVPQSKKNIYQLIYPSLINLTLQMVSADHIKLVQLEPGKSLQRPMKTAVAVA